MRKLVQRVYNIPGREYRICFLKSPQSTSFLDIYRNMLPQKFTKFISELHSWKVSEKVFVIESSLGVPPNAIPHHYAGLKLPHSLRRWPNCDAPGIQLWPIIFIYLDATRPMYIDVLGSIPHIYVKPLAQCVSSKKQVGKTSGKKL